MIWSIETLLNRSQSRPRRGADSPRTPCWSKLPSSSAGESRSTGTRRWGEHGWMPSTEAAAGELQDCATLWSAGEIPATDVVSAACDALVADLGSPGLRMLAACTRAEAPYDVHDLLPVALDELGLVLHPPGSEAGREAAVRTLARRMLAGRLQPWELTFRIHQNYGRELPLTERLAALDHEYAILEGSDEAVAQIDAEVTAEARHLAEDHPRVPAEPADGST